MHKGIYTHSLSHETKFNYKDITAKEPEKEKHDTHSKDYEVIRKLVMEKEGKKKPKKIK